MNEIIGHGECPKCGKPTFSGQRFMCQTCDFQPLSQEALENIFGGPPKEFVVPQYEKDQNFSEAFRHAFRAFMRPNYQYEFHWIDGGRFVDVMKYDRWDFAENGNVIGTYGQSGGTTLYLKYVDKILRLPSENLSPELADAVCNALKVTKQAEEDDKADAPMSQDELEEAIERMSKKGLQEFVVPQHEKDQGFSEAFRDALHEFLDVGKTYRWCFTDGHIERFRYVDMLNEDDVPIIVCDTGDTMRRLVSCRRLDKIVHCPTQKRTTAADYDMANPESRVVRSVDKEFVRPEVCSDCIRKDTEHCGYEDTFWPKDCKQYQRKEPILPLGQYSPKEKLMFVPHYLYVFEGDIVKCRGTGWEYKLGAEVEGVSNRYGNNKVFTVVACVGKDIPTHIADRFGISRMNTEGFSNCDEPIDSEMVQLSSKVSDSPAVMEVFRRFCSDKLDTLQSPMDLVTAFNYPDDIDTATAIRPLDYSFWTDRAREVLRIARKCARDHKHTIFTTDHLLFGILQVKGSVAHTVLSGLGDIRKSDERVRIALNKLRECTYNPSKPTVVSDKVEEAYKHGVEVARDQLKCAYFGTEHLLLGLLRAERQDMNNQYHLYGVSYRAAYNEIRHLLGMKSEEFDAVDTEQTYTLAEIIPLIDGRYLARRLVWPDSIRMKVLDLNTPCIFDSNPKNQNHTSLNSFDIQATDWVIVKENQ